jgi:ribonuclease BN (tRNA processing enzyme)
MARAGYSGHPVASDGDDAREMVRGLLAATTAELEQVLADADANDMAMREPAAGAAPRRLPAPWECEVVILGSLGCRHGMLAGGAGGHLVRTASATVLVDPGPAALGCLLDLARKGLFTWQELDAICVTHLHPDHYADVIPCLEGMATHSRRRKSLLVNPTVAERFTAFSPYHFGGMADVIILAHPDTDGNGEPAAKVGDLTIHATPALHTEDKGRARTAIGLAYDTPAGGIWYTSDTNLATGLLGSVAAIMPEPALVIAHDDASNITQAPGRTQACHLETRDVPAIAAALQPSHVLIHHYDAAYSSARYRIAQAAWLQRALDEQALPTRVLPSASGQRFTLAAGRLASDLPGGTDDAGPAVAAYLQAQEEDPRHDYSRQEGHDQ